jgi:hypothetical protein
MTSGLTVLGVMNLGFWMEETRTDVNEGELCVYKSCSGMAAERHCRKPSEEARDALHERKLKRTASAKL